MGTQIIPQPDGLYSLFASEIDDFVMLNGTERDVFEYFIREAAARAKKSVSIVLRKQKRGEPAYFNWTKTFEEALAIAEDRHGPDAESVIFARKILEENSAEKPGDEFSTEST